MRRNNPQSHRPRHNARRQDRDQTHCRASIPVKTQNDELDIFTKKKPYEGAAPFRGRSGTNLYYISVQPTAVLDKLKAAFDRIDFTVANGKDFVRLQSDLNKVFADNMVHVSHNYVAPYLSKKVAYHYSEAQHLDYSTVVWADIEKIVADQKRGASTFSPATPCDVLQAAFGTSPALLLMFFCLVEPLPQSVEFIQSHMAAFVCADHHEPRCSREGAP